MTNHWVDIKNADAVLIMGSNAAENHPVAFKWVMDAKLRRGAKIISVDPRFTRSSSKADIYAPMRSGTDIVFLGGMINYAISNNLINEQYVKDCTNALCRVNPGFSTCRDSGRAGLFSGFPAPDTYGQAYTTTTWDYLYDGAGDIAMAADLTVSDCVYQKLKKQYETYTPEMVEKICGTPQEVFLDICEAYIDGTYQDDRSGTMLYAMGWTQHTVGSQNIRAASILQLLLGNMGVAGGGINALRGWQNVQGSTDHAVLYDWFPGYIGYPENTADLGYGTLAGYIAKVTPANLDPVPGVPPASGNWKTKFNLYITSTLRALWPTVPAATSYDYLPKRALSKNYSHISIFEDMLPTPPDNIIKGLFVWGTNPGVIGPNVKRERQALNNLDWMVVCDIFETETSNFWKYNTDGTPRVDGGGGQGTEVFVLPGSAFFERKGSVTNSGRLAQWKDRACSPPGDALAEEEILKKLGDKIKLQYAGSVLAKDAGIVKLNWPHDPLLSGDLTECVAKEIHGYYPGLLSLPISGTHLGPNNSTVLIDSAGRNLASLGVETGMVIKNTTDGCSGTVNSIYTTNSTNDTLEFTLGPSSGLSGGTENDFDTGDSFTVYPLVANFTSLKAGGTTACGNWLFSGTWTAGGVNNMAKRTPIDTHPAGIGIYANWGYAWPLNRRIIYNRASVRQTGGSPNEGQPLAPDKWVIKWNWDEAKPGGGSWDSGGDVIDGYKTSATGTLPANWVNFKASAYYPFIMNNEGLGKLMGIKKLVEGPFPEHYEPRESPFIPGTDANLLTGATFPLYNPCVYQYAGTVFGSPADYPIVCTTYRLSEHWHGGGMSRNLPGLAELMPEPFVEMSEELATDTLVIPTGPIANGDDVIVSSARGSITVKACVTKRFKPFTINGNTTVHQVGLPWHWGHVSSLTPPCTGDSANVLTPHIGDANTRIPEYKAFLVKIEKA